MTNQSYIQKFSALRALICYELLRISEEKLMKNQRYTWKIFPRCARQFDQNVIKVNFFKRIMWSRNGTNSCAGFFLPSYIVPSDQNLHHFLLANVSNCLKETASTTRKCMCCKKKVRKVSPSRSPKIFAKLALFADFDSRKRGTPG